MQPSTLRSLLIDLHEAEDAIVSAFTTKDPRDRTEHLRHAVDLTDIVHDRLVKTIDGEEKPPSNSEAARAAR